MIDVRGVREWRAALRAKRQPQSVLDAECVRDGANKNTARL